MTGILGITSESPMTLISSARCKSSTPAEARRAPPMPKALRPGRSRRSSSTARAACRSALASVATTSRSSGEAASGEGLTGPS
jgi:hypothetical protein